jgi:hypothetical protein
MFGGVLLPIFSPYSAPSSEVISVIRDEMILGGPEAFAGFGNGGLLGDKGLIEGSRDAIATFRIAILLSRDTLEISHDPMKFRNPVNLSKKSRFERVLVAVWRIGYICLYFKQKYVSELLI